MKSKTAMRASRTGDALGQQGRGSQRHARLERLAAAGPNSIVPAVLALAVHVRCSSGVTLGSGERFDHGRVAVVEEETLFGVERRDGGHLLRRQFEVETLKFSAMRCLWVDFGMATTPVGSASAR